MSEFVMLIASAKILAGKRSNFSWPLISRLPHPHNSPSTENSSTTKDQKLTKCFLPRSHRFSLQSSQYQYWKANTYFILMVIELGPPVS